MIRWLLLLPEKQKTDIICNMFQSIGGRIHCSMVESNDHTESISQSLLEIRMIKDSELKAKTADELFDEL